MEQRVFRLARWLVLGIVIFYIAWGSTSEPIELYEIDMQFPSLSKGWTQVIDGTTVSLANVQDFTPVQAGETLILETTLVDVPDNTVFTFYTKNQEVRVYLDDVLTYEFAIQENFTALKTPGNEWHQVFLSEELTGATLRVEFTSQFDYYSSLLYDFYIVHYNEMLGLQLEWLWLRIATGVFLVVVAVVSYVNGCLWHGTAMRRYLMRMGDFYMTLSLWVFANAGSFDIIFCRPIISYYLEMLSLRMVPIMAYLFVHNVLSRKYRLFNALGWCVFANFFGTVILQFCFGVSFLSTLWLTHLILVVGALFAFYIIIWHLYLTRDAKEERNYLFICTGIMFVSALLEVWRFYVMPEQDVWISAYIAVGYVLYTIIAYVVMVYRSAGLDRGRLAMETHYNKLQNTTLMRQINAHFFFNTLNTVSALCKNDPEKADEAINLLAKYMRHYMYFINTGKTIQFVNELDLMRIYLTIEQMRFKDAFAVKMDISFDEFELPALSIQPIVENAVMHGLRQRERYGELIIISEKKGTNAVITVQDNGVGFDVSILDEQESIALNNIRTRLATTVNGAISVESEIEKGTKVTVTIPLGKTKAKAEQLAEASK